MHAVFFAILFRLLFGRLSAGRNSRLTPHLTYVTYKRGGWPTTTSRRCIWASGLGCCRLISVLFRLCFEISVAKLLSWRRVLERISGCAVQHHTRHSTKCMLSREDTAARTRLDCQKSCSLAHSTSAAFDSRAAGNRAVLGSDGPLHSQVLFSLRLDSFVNRLHGALKGAVLHGIKLQRRRFRWLDGHCRPNRESQAVWVVREREGCSFGRT